MFKFLGPVESRIDFIREVFNVFKQQYQGCVVNDIDAMSYFITKEYLAILRDNGICIPNFSFEPSTISFEYIKANYCLNSKIIKPISGELSNSFSKLENIIEEWLRQKEKLVKGWIIQDFSDKVYGC